MHVGHCAKGWEGSGKLFAEGPCPRGIYTMKRERDALERQEVIDKESRMRMNFYGVRGAFV